MITNNLHHNYFDIDVQNVLHIPREKNFIKISLQRGKCQEAVNIKKKFNLNKATENYHFVEMS